MSVDLLVATSERARAVLAGVRPEQYDDPTPCASWKVRDVINHLVGANHWFADTVESGTAPTSESDVGGPDVVDGDVLAAYDEASKRAIEAFRAPEALDKTLTLPFGDVPAAAFCMLAANDQYVHAWDLATATGQQTDVAPELAEQLLGFAEQAVGDALRGADGQAPFGPRVTAPEAASAAAKLAAFCGRAV